jgi:hypothetical protein
VIKGVNCSAVLAYVFRYEKESKNLPNWAKKYRDKRKELRLNNGGYHLLTYVKGKSFGLIRDRQI